MWEEKAHMQPAPTPVHDPPSRRRRRRVTPPIGVVAGAVAGLVVAAVIDILAGSVTPVAYLGAALLGAVIGFVMALLIPAEIDDGDDDAYAARHEHGARPGRADAPIEGAHARDAE
jgi:hypothetical protein